ncbi:hypothetical protein EBQ34_01175 [Vandammella animalimorsus]|uniref:Uncharacterized protein n=1 Tax=Vandammella animalimorsus TaxID=2029117 RepID=A0A3M6RUJ5_9BURK|nr:hypothetical protein [Vandammella animalimorsus]RMX18996.1 hypothetical protein EBQ34_01175 [Vandammella animalimorsus]
MTTFALQPSGQPDAKVVQDQQQVNQWLGALGLDEQWILQARIAGMDSRGSLIPGACALTAAGSLQWHYTVQAVRAQLGLQGWSLIDPRGCPFAVSPDRSVALVVMTGDAATGLPDQGPPRNSSTKGRTTQAAIDGDLFRQPEGKHVEDFQQENLATQVWVLLIHYDERLRESRAELSRPNGFDGRYITSWGTRLLLEPVAGDGAVVVTPVGDAPTAPQPVVVEVSPKTGT